MRQPQPQNAQTQQKATEKAVMGGEQLLDSNGDFNPTAIQDGTVRSELEGQIVRDATDKNPRLDEDAQAQAADKRRFYRVLKGGQFADPHSKSRATLKAGKEIDSLNYNVRELQKQGIVLERIETPSAADESSFVD